MSLEATVYILRKQFNIDNPEDMSGTCLTQRFRTRRNVKNNSVDIVKESLMEVVDENFDGFWTDASLRTRAPSKDVETSLEGLLQEIEMEDAQLGGEDGGLPGGYTVASASTRTSRDKSGGKKSDVRELTATLAQITRPDMMEQLPTMERILRSKQDALSYYMDEVSIVMFKMTVEAVVRLVTFNIRDPYFVDQAVVEAGVITEGILREVALGQQSKERQVDRIGLLNQDFIEYVAACLYGRGSRNMSVGSSSRVKEIGAGSKAGETGSVHPSWDKCVAAMLPSVKNTIGGSSSASPNINPEVRTPEGIFLTANTLYREYATNVTQLWTGSLYKDLRDRVIQYLLRLWLRPQKEQQYRDVKIEQAKEKASAVAEAKDLFDQLNDSIERLQAETCGESRIVALLGLIDLHDQNRPHNNTESGKSPRIKQFQDDEDDDDCDATNPSRATALDLDTASTPLYIDGPASSHLIPLQVVTRILLEDPYITGEVMTDMVADILHDPEKFTGEELDAVVHIVNQLRPYTPKKCKIGNKDLFPKHILTVGPLAFICNSFLRAAGYQEFTRNSAPPIRQAAYTPYR
ncbi:hypothetical protein KI688_011905 [Linnemannia hyalina]|uniref:Uncharacterized protein n=1 Tax=Linnemannia hyalina TaxID=64524 RepID=A0A9P7XWD2_9FUNG|nr:hypothetical protein KI688_011905 [Linnemannia hyalina]